VLASVSASVVGHGMVGLASLRNHGHRAGSASHGHRRRSVKGIRVRDGQSGHRVRALDSGHGSGSDAGSLDSRQENRAAHGGGGRGCSMLGHMTSTGRCAGMVMLVRVRMMRMMRMRASMCVLMCVERRA
jgi:hypothetical protein